jgi:hypothetical protein
MDKKRSLGSIDVGNKLYDLNPLGYKYGVIRRLDSELNLYQDKESKINRSHFPNLLMTRCKLAKTRSFIRKKSDIQDIVADKKQIILLKMRVAEKWTQIRQLKEQFVYQEKQSQLQLTDFKENTDMVKHSMDGQKKEIETFFDSINDLKKIRNGKIKSLFEVRNTVQQKEKELRNFDYKIHEFQSFKNFIVSIYHHFGRQFDESTLLDFIEAGRNALKKRFAIRKSLNNSCVKISKEDTVNGKSFFLTSSKAVKRRSSCQSFSTNNQIRDNFRDMINKLENEHFELLNEIQTEEADVIDQMKEENR